MSELRFFFIFGVSFSIAPAQQIFIGVRHLTCIRTIFGVIDQISDLCNFPRIRSGGLGCRFLCASRREERVIPSSAFTLIVRISRISPLTSVANGVCCAGALAVLVESWPAARTDPTGLGVAMTAVGTRSTLGAHGVQVSGALTRGPVTGIALGTRVAGVTVTGQDWQGLEHKKIDKD